MNTNIELTEREVGLIIAGLRCRISSLEDTSYDFTDEKLLWYCKNQVERMNNLVAKLATHYNIQL